MTQDLQKRDLGSVISELGSSLWSPKFQPNFAYTYPIRLSSECPNIRPFYRTLHPPEHPRVLTHTPLDSMSNITRTFHAQNHYEQKFRFCRAIFVSGTTSIDPTYPNSAYDQVTRTFNEMARAVEALEVDIVRVRMFATDLKEHAEVARALNVCGFGLTGEDGEDYSTSGRLNGGAVHTEEPMMEMQSFSEGGKNQSLTNCCIYKLTQSRRTAWGYGRVFNSRLSRLSCNLLTTYQFPSPSFSSTTSRFHRLQRFLSQRILPTSNICGFCL
ncbi:hypothetical protein L218DRAFT_264138 [Marasmius fiardii PR-910]|nr:hypothetical protein L218DRAFT_264138 [Marasmius fiardii PR-910]